MPTIAHESAPPLLAVTALRYRYAAASGRANVARDSQPGGEGEIHFGSFLLPAKTVLLVRGGSGAGKSTLLHLLAGVLPLQPTHGSAVLAGRELAGLPVAARDGLRPFEVGWMPQRLCLIDTLNLRENVLLPLSLAGRVNAAAAQRAEQLMQALAIAPLALRRPAAISVGQAARVSLARALVARPKLLLADEPTAALDAASAGLVAQAIATYVAEGGAALVASHDPALDALLAAAAAAIAVTALELPR